MLRKALLPLFAATLLGGCVTGYDYRGGGGDYYYGRPSVDYRYYGDYSGPYSHGYYNRYYGGYGPTFGYGYPYYYGYGRPIIVRPGYGHPRPGHGDGPGHDGRNRGNGRAPWRNLDRVGGDRGPRVQSPSGLRQGPAVAAPVRPAGPPQSGNRGSRMEQAIRSAKEPRPRTVEP